MEENANVYCILVVRETTMLEPQANWLWLPTICLLEVALRRKEWELGFSSQQN